MIETLESMENRWTLLMAARYGAGHPRAGELVHQVDAKYAREAFALRAQIEERKTAEAKRPQINHDQLAWLDRLRGVEENGKPLLLDKGERGSKFRTTVFQAQARLERGEDISTTIASTEQDLTARQLVLPAPAVDQSAIIQQRAANHLGSGMPPNSARQLGAGAIISKRT